jgi:hypothetical protein
VVVTAERPDAGGFGGEVELAWEGEPPAHARRFGWAFAEQRRGPAAHRVDALAGAGMLLRREAVERSGWPRGPLLADRVGRRLVSGGDVELALRVGAVAPLVYDPRLRLRHVVSAERAAARQLVPLVFGLGVAQQFAAALTEPGGRRGFVASLPHRAVPLVRPIAWALRERRPWDAALAGVFLAGWLAALARRPARRELLGRALRPA